MRRRLAIALSVLAACTPDGSLLAEQGSGGGGGGGGAAGDGSTAVLVSSGASGGDGGAATTAGPGGGGPSSSSSAGGGGPVEPDGPPRLALVHGLLDRARFSVCLAGDGEIPAVSPTPRGGLAYASSAEIELAALPVAGDVSVFLVAGPSSELADASCDALLEDPAGAAPLEVSLVGAIPRAAVEAPRLLALVVAGCLGGADQESELGEAACGPGYAASSPTASLLVTALSRITSPERVGLQVAAGALASAPFDVALRNDPGEAAVQLAEDLSLGAALPFPPHTAFVASDLLPTSNLSLVATLPNEEVVLAEVPLAPALERAGLAALAAGETHALVVVGPTLTLGEGPFWRGPDVAVVRAR